MINVKDFILDNIGNEDIGCYALVSYNGKTEATWFSIFYDLNKKGDVLVVESPCELNKVCAVGEDIDAFCSEYIKSIVDLNEGATESKSELDYIENFIKPMIVDGFFYIIEAFQVVPYLPYEVDDIKIVSEKECLDWLLDNI